MESVKRTSMIDIFLTALTLGVTSFGGPIAHIGFFRAMYVAKKKWISDGRFAELVAISQFLPGPASSQLGMGIGLMQGGIPGAIAAWIGFTLPSAVIMTASAFFIRSFAVPEGIMKGLIIAAVAVVAQAVYAMGRTHAPDTLRAVFAALSAVIVLTLPHPITPIAVIAAAGTAGAFLFRGEKMTGSFGSSVTRRMGIVFLAAFFILLAALPFLSALFPASPISLAADMYRAGSLVFGGGHVLLPMLKDSLPPGMTQTTYLSGYGIAQMLPGPLFTIAAFIGAYAYGMPGALIALCALFLPAFLLIVGVLPLWESIRSRSRMRAAVAGVNAAVVGVLLAALVHPMVITSIRTPIDAALGIAVFASLQFGKVPPWAAVAASALIFFGMSMIFGMS